MALKKSSKLVSIAICMFMIAGTLAGCAGGGTKKTASDSKETAKTQQVKKPTGTVTFTRSKDVTGGAAAILEAFAKEYPDIKVNIQEVPATDMHNAFVTALSANDSSVDVYNIDVIWTAEFAASNFILPLDKYFPKEAQKIYLPGPIEGATYDGKVYAVPFYTDAAFMFYRTDLVQKPPQTWQELIDISKKLVSENKVKYGYVTQAKQAEGLVCNALEYIWGNNGQVLDGKTVKINNANAEEGLNLYKEVLKVAPEGVTTYVENDSLVAFKEGRAAFMRNWSYAWAGSNAEDSQVKGKVGVAPIPKGPKGDKTGISTLGGWNLAINKNSKNADAAWEFVKYATSEKGQMAHSLKSARMPTVSSLYSNEEMLKTNPHFKDLYSALTNAKPRPVTPYYSAISDSMQIEFHKFITGSSDAKTALTNVSKSMESILSKK